MISGYEKIKIVSISISETIFLMLFTFYFLSQWYPSDYFLIYSVWLKISVCSLFLFLLGPVLSIFFHKPDFYAYANDLTVVFSIKILALILFMFFEYQQRPMFVVYSVDRFVVVQAHQISIDMISPGLIEARAGSSDLLTVAARQVGSDNLGLMMEVLSGAPDIEYRPVGYEQFEYQKKEFLERFCGTREVDTSTMNTPESPCISVEVPLVYKLDKFATAVYDVEKAKISKIVQKDPW